ncbi:MAG TPA: SDR family oxidoreductase [Casimicrobiaceae bacterium]|nr:SDR family oxidoreductase [Casimicrobiaceae bacterium]
MSAAREPAALKAASQQLRDRPLRWLVTGGAGFIGSHLVEALLRLGQQVATLDNFETGHRQNLAEVRAAVGESCWRQHEFLEADIVDPASCRRACRGVNIVLHEAALGSVPRSISDPLRTHAVNATGFLNMLVAARDAGVARFVFASSSSVYGDAPQLPKIEERIGGPLSPYAATKYLDEIYAEVFGRCYDMVAVGLRYFNVFGPRQDPEGAYAAVIPRWVETMLQGRPIVIYGDGETTRDFCYVANVVQANLLAATTTQPQALGQVYNVALGGRLSLNTVFETLRRLLRERHPDLRIAGPVHEDFRPGDIRHSQADIGKARRLLGYDPVHDVQAGLGEALPWYEKRLRRTGGGPIAEAQRVDDVT